MSSGHYRVDCTPCMALWVLELSHKFNIKKKTDKEIHITLVIDIVMIAIYLKEQTECYYFEKKGLTPISCQRSSCQQQKKAYFHCLFSVWKTCRSVPIPSVRLRPHKALSTLWAQLRAELLLNYLPVHFNCFLVLHAATSGHHLEKKTTNFIILKMPFSDFPYDVYCGWNMRWQDKMNR